MSLILRLRIQRHQLPSERSNTGVKKVYDCSAGLAEQAYDRGRTPAASARSHGYLSALGKQGQALLTSLFNGQPRSPAFE